jgi:hypothetical protein
MAYNTDSTNLFNPMTFWTDLGLRGLEMTLSSTQNITDGVERLTRAGASTAASEQIESPVVAASEPIASATSSALELTAQMQRTTFEMMTRMWEQWMSAFATLAIGTQRSGESMVRQNPWLNMIPDGLQPGLGVEVGATSKGSGSSRGQSASRRNGNARSESREHAAAQGETRRRSRASAKSKPRSRSR